MALRWQAGAGWVCRRRGQVEAGLLGEARRLAGMGLRRGAALLQTLQGGDLGCPWRSCPCLPGLPSAPGARPACVGAFSSTKHPLRLNLVPSDCLGVSTDPTD